ncbi:DNA excision repair protein Ercc1 isoform X2 [Lycorma delicatula]|uniref:DNA excision repair protein Ercc1 isoform X2 n=1 Tax=Lycorma delicatula TaxID=130591 RepID=UPI003F5164CA
MDKESLFAAQFSKLKKSERYETIQEACGSASTEQELGEPSGTSKPRPVSKSGVSNAILVSPKQRGNPLLKSITNFPWEYDESIIPDYVMGRTTCALFLSLRYHTLKPDYIAERLKLLGKLYDLRVLLVQIDQKDPHHALKHLTRICLLADLTLMLAWSAEEAGRIIETYKIFQNKPPDMIMEKQETDPHLKICCHLLPPNTQIIRRRMGNIHQDKTAGLPSN